MYIKIISALVLASLILSCKTSIKLAVPQAFKQEADMHHVSGARGNKMKMDNYSISKIKRGIHMAYPGWNRGFFLENIFLNQIGLEKKEHVKKEKAKFRYTVTDGTNTLDVFGKEQQLFRSTEYKLLGRESNIFNSWERVQQYQYIFSVGIHSETAGINNWELLMTNLYDRRKDTVNSLFTVIRPDESGLATNGKDTFYVKPVSLKNTESEKGIIGKLPFQVLSGYEVSTSDGVISIIDLIDSNIWFYKQLEASDKLVITAIATSLFARRVSNTNW